MKKFDKKYYGDGSNLVSGSYKGYTYDPQITNGEVIHNITNPKGILFGIAPNWFKNLSGYDYATNTEFKCAVDEIEKIDTNTTLPIRY
jgi:hypothetical protein